MPERFLGDGIAGEGMIKDLSLRGIYIGNAPISVWMALALETVADQSRHGEMGQRI